MCGETVNNPHTKMKPAAHNPCSGSFLKLLQY